MTRRPPRSRRAWTGPSPPRRARTSANRGARRGIVPGPGPRAASAALAVGLATSYLPDRDRGPIYADIDGSGRIDIADVLALAREGVAQAELDAFARRVVALDRDGTP